MNKITEGSRWISEIGNKVVVVCVHEYGIMLKYIGNGRVHALSHEDFLDFFTPLPKTHKVFRLWKYLEDENFTSKNKAQAILHGRYLESEGKTKFATQTILDDNWLVEEEIK